MKDRLLLLKSIVLLIILLQGIAASAGDVVRVGVAWRPGLTNNDRVVQAIKLAGGEAVMLEQVRPAGFGYDSLTLQLKHVDANGVLLPREAEQVKRTTWHGSNAAQVLEGIDAVVFLGGGDISSTLFRNPQQWGGETCDATRDLSEYLTMAYCLDHDIPVLGLCRGMQMLSVVSGATMIQDLGTYFGVQNVEYNNLHRSISDENGNRHYVHHDVVITDKQSLIYNIMIDDSIKNVPSWHHQVVGDVTDTSLKVTGVTPTQGYDVIEVVERSDKTFALGVQFHPEEAVRKHLADEIDAKEFMRLYEGLNFFEELIKAVNNK